MVRHLRVVGASFAAALLLSTSVISPDPRARPGSGSGRSRCSAATGSMPAASPRRAGSSAQAVVPTGFTDQPTLTGLTAPTVVQFAPDGRVFVAEKRGMIKVFDSLSDTTPTTFADLRTQVDDYWDRGLLGHGAAAELPDQPLRVRPVHVRRPDRRHGPGVERRLPDAARPDDRRLRGQRPAVAAPGERRRQHRARAGAHQRLVPAAPEPLHRHGRVRARRRALRERRRRRELQRRRLRPDRRQPAGTPDPGEPVRGPGRRGRRAAEPGPADDADRRRRGRRRTVLQRDRAGRCARSPTGASARRAGRPPSTRRATSPGTYTGSYALGQAGALSG